MVVLIRLIAVKILLEISPKYWIARIFIPVLLVAAISSLVGALPQLFMTSSIGRIILTTFCVELILLPLLYGVVLDKEERLFIVSKFQKMLSRIFKSNEN
jgi:hypothetical protein